MTLRGIDASYRRMPAFFDDVGWRRFRDHAPEYIKDETLTPHDEAPCTIMSMNARMGGFPNEVAKRCLLIYSSASLPSEDDGGRIAMSDRLSSIDPNTHLYRRYLREVLGRLDTDADDWLLLSSEVLSGLLAECGHDAAWAKPIAWETYASTRYDALREQLGSLLDGARRRSMRPPPDTEGWYAEGVRIWVRVGANSFGHPDFEWRDLSTYMLHEHESRAAEFVLDLQAVERFNADRVQNSRTWDSGTWPSSRPSRAPADRLIRFASFPLTDFDSVRPALAIRFPLSFRHRPMCRASLTESLKSQAMSARSGPASPAGAIPPVSAEDARAVSPAKAPGCARIAAGPANA